MVPLVRMLVSVVALLSFALIQADDGCGYEPPPDKGPGEPCTRSAECESSLVCSGGVCMQPGFDAGPDDAGMDASTTADASPDAATDASMDAALDSGAPADASLDAGDAAPADDGASSDASADGGGG
ncbi:MAG: hypothetical protein AB8I08_28795 [Sandaracinaceae bacterium]